MNEVGPVGWQVGQADGVADRTNHSTARSIDTVGASSAASASRWLRSAADCARVYSIVHVAGGVVEGELSELTVEAPALDGHRALPRVRANARGRMPAESELRYSWWV